MRISLRSFALACLFLAGCSRTTVFFCGTPDDPPCPSGFVCVSNRCLVDTNPTDGGTTVIRVSAATLPTGATGGVHAGVIFFSAPPGATTEADLILSWR